ncbi:MAG: hypothetical protein R3C59_15055 [Planctomycetaceae bacterium]
MLRLTMTCLAVVLAANAGHADDKDTTATTIRFEQVVPAKSVINHRVEDSHGVLVGTVADIVLDRQYGRVAFFAITSRRSGNTVASNYFIAPGAVDLWTADGRLRLKIPFEKVEHVGDIVKPVPMTYLDPAALKQLYHEHGAEPYWQQDKKNSSNTLYLVTTDELDGRIIRDADWNKLARVEEVLLCPQDGWKVAYLALDELRGHDRDDLRIAVPMGAFARKTLSPTWLLDVPLEAELLKKTFEPDDWPKEIDRGWIEFTHVKYGTSSLGGLVDLQDEEGS